MLFHRARLYAFAACLAVSTWGWVVVVQAQPAEAPKSPAAKAADAPATAEPVPDTAGRSRAGVSRQAAEESQAELFKSVRVFQQRYLLKAGRVEVLGGGSAYFGDPLIRHYSVDAGALYHLDETWAFGLDGVKYFGATTDAFSAIQTDYGLFPERSLMQAGGFAEVQFSPVFGKFSSFGIAVLQVDAYLLAGGGVVRTTRGEDLKPAGHFGIGARVHTLRWLTLSAEARDVFYVENFAARDEFIQQLSVGLRVGFWIPPTVTYRYQR